jgi:hypothetical protein
MRSMDHCNVVSLKHCFFSTTSRDELFLNLVMEFVPESLYRVLKHYSNMNQRMPLIYVKLYTYQVRSHLYSFGNFCYSYCYIYSRLDVILIFFSWSFYADISRFSLYSHSTWSLPQGCETTESFGMACPYFLNLVSQCLNS